MRCESASSRRIASTRASALDRQVAVEREALAVHAGGHQREQDRRRPDQRHDGDSPSRAPRRRAARPGRRCRGSPRRTGGRGRARAGRREQIARSARRGVAPASTMRDLLQRQRGPSDFRNARAGFAFSTTKWARPRATAIVRAGSTSRAATTPSRLGTRKRRPVIGRCVGRSGGRRAPATPAARSMLARAGSAAGRSAPSDRRSRSRSKSAMPSASDFTLPAQS